MKKGKVDKLVQPICCICGKEISEEDYITVKTKRGSDLSIDHKCFQSQIGKK